MNKRGWVAVATLAVVTLVGCRAGTGGVEEGGDVTLPTGADELTETAANAGVELVQCTDLPAPVDVEAVEESGCLNGEALDIAATYDCEDGRTAVMIGGRMALNGGEWVDLTTDDAGPWDLC